MNTLPYEVQAILDFYTTVTGWEGWTCSTCGGEYPRDIVVACPRCSPLATRLRQAAAEADTEAATTTPGPPPGPPPETLVCMGVDMYRWSQGAWAVWRSVLGDLPWAALSPRDVLTFHATAEKAAAHVNAQLP